jgi:glycosyltransferase involved in cell wall biosynthesis
MKIILDGSDAIVGTRAIRRYAINLINEFSLRNQPDQFKIFLNYFRGKNKAFDGKINSKKNMFRIRYPMPRHFSLPLWKVFNFPSINIFTGKADIFHALGDDCPPIKHAAYIMTLHGMVYMTRPDLVDPVYVLKKKAWLRRMTRRANFFISVSEHTKKEFLKFFSFIEPERVRVIPLGVGSEFRIIPKDEIQRQLYRRFKVSRPYILYVGGLEPHKNIAGIIKGFSMLAEHYQDLLLLLVGCEYGPPLDIINLISSLNLKKRIRIMKYFSQGSDDLPILYNGAECFVFPSFSEGWTSPPLEAMACGTPVVTSNVSSLPETVNGAALLVDPDSHEDISQAMDKVLSDCGLNQELQRKGLQHAAKFTWKRCADKTYAFYKEVFESR